MPQFQLWGNEKPHPGQAKLWRLRHAMADGEPPDFALLACGTRWGKDRLTKWTALSVGFDLLSKRADSDLIPRVHQWVAAPTYKLQDQLWREYCTTLKPLAPRIQESDWRITLPGDYVIEFRSTEREDGLDGVGLDILHGSECPNIADSAWHEHLKQRLLSPGRRGLALLNGTPGIAPADWYCALWDRAEAGDPRVLLVNEPSWENPFLDTRQLLEIEADRNGGMPEIQFRTVYGAERIAVGGGVFRCVDKRSTASIADPVAGAEYVTFTDLGYDDSNGSVTYRVDGQFRKHPVQVFADRWNRTEWPLTRLRIVGIGRRYPGLLSIDATKETFKENLADDLRRDLAGVCSVGYARFTAPVKEAAVFGFAAALESANVTLLRPDTCNAALVQYRELSEFQATRTAFGNVTFAAPKGKHDDMAVAAFSAHKMASDMPTNARAAWDNAVGSLY